jgi:hypothetical protein
MTTPQEPLAGALQPLAPREPSAGLQQALTPWETPCRQSNVAPHRLRDLLQLRSTTPTLGHSRPQARPHVGVGRTKCPANKNKGKIYQIKQ